MKRTPILVRPRQAPAVGRVLAQRAEGLQPIHAAPGDPARVISGQMGGADGASVAGTRTSRGLDRPSHEPFPAHLGTSVRGQARQSVPGPGTSR